MKPLVSSALIVALVGTGAYLAFLPARHGSMSFWFIMGGPTVVLAALGAWRAARSEQLREWITPKWGDFTRGFVAAALLFGVAALFTKVMVPADSPRKVWLISLYGQLGDPKVLEAHALLVAGMIVVIATAEELLWRGHVTALCSERFGSRTGWVWAAVFYALAHVPTMWSLKADSGLNPILPLAALGAGLLWGAMARFFGRLAPGILAHALFDWCVIMMFPLWQPGA